LGPGDYYGLKWTLLQSRGARAINRAFLDWIPREGPGGRPFFAFLNYMDAHEPFLIPGDSGPRFGASPETARDFTMLVDYWELDKTKLGARDVALARDSYDDCIAFLDREVGSLLDELERRGVLRDTVVLITSDHGEEFGEHGVFNHGYSLYQQEVHVPLLVLSPMTAALPDRVVSEAVSLRDLPATVGDLLGLSTGSPFPGASLASLWQEAPGTGRPAVSPALSEVSVTPVLDPRRGRGPTQRGYAMSMVAGGHHLIRDSFGTESLFDLDADPKELRDIKFSAQSLAVMGRLRASIHKVLTSDPARIGISVLYLERYTKALETLIGARTGSDGPDPQLKDSASRGAGPAPR
jgi:arylsulfatase A-like enzyme